MRLLSRRTRTLAILCLTGIVAEEAEDSVVEVEVGPRVRAVCLRNRRCCSTFSRVISSACHCESGAALTHLHLLPFISSCIPASLSSPIAIDRRAMQSAHLSILASLSSLITCLARTFVGHEAFAAACRRSCSSATIPSSLDPSDHVCSSTSHSPVLRSSAS